MSLKKKKKDETSPHVAFLIPSLLQIAQGDTTAPPSHFTLTRTLWGRSAYKRVTGPRLQGSETRSHSILLCHPNYYTSEATTQDGKIIQQQRSMFPHFSRLVSFSDLIARELFPLH